jgi:hypothetical protein
MTRDGTVTMMTAGAGAVAMKAAATVAKKDTAAVVVDGDARTRYSPTTD